MLPGITKASRRVTDVFSNHNLNEIISKNNIVKDQVNQFAQNKDTQNISEITINEKPDIELDIGSQDLEEKNKELEEVNEKTKNIFAN